MWLSWIGCKQMVIMVDAVRQMLYKTDILRFVARLKPRSHPVSGLF